LNPDVPKGIDAITIRLLAKNPDERYSDAAELIEDLERVTKGLEPASATTRVMKRLAPAGTARTPNTTPMSPAPPETRDGGERRRRRGGRLWVPILLLLLLLALLGGISYAFAQGILSPKVKVPNLVGASSIEEAKEWAGEDFKVIEGARKESKEPVGTVLGQDPEAGTEESKGSTISVDVSGTQIADLPDVKGKTREEAERTLKRASFEVETKTRESSAQEKNLVIGQDPRGGEGETAKLGSTVTITVGNGPAPVNVPNLYNLTPAAAKQALEGAGLLLGNQTEASSDQVPKGQIVDQQPAAGTQVEPGSSVDVTVSSGPRRIEVPDVVGRNVEEAKQTIWDAGFGYTVETAQSNQPAGTVISTDPAAGTLLDPYSRNVTIRQSAGPPPPPPVSKTGNSKTGNSKTGNSKAEGKGKSG
jgi:serine/threonine-protein kinase